MKAQHTPGPWKVESVPAVMSTLQKDFLITYTDDGLRSHVARLFDNSLCTEHGTTEANARLIAAAPELLAALESMLTHIGMDEDEWNKPTFDQARAAIAKARGEV